MRRRDVLRTTATIGVVGLAGCGADGRRPRRRIGPPTEPPERPASDPDEEPFAVESLDYTEDEAGNLVVVVSVANDDDHERSGTLRASVGAGGTTMSNAKDVTVAAGETTAVELPFAMNFSDFEQSGSIDLDLSAE